MTRCGTHLDAKLWNVLATLAVKVVYAMQGKEGSIGSSRHRWVEVGGAGEVCIREVREGEERGGGGRIEKLRMCVEALK